MGASVPGNFNWVKSRADCSLAVVFKSLEHGVSEDVKVANGLVGSSPIRFSLVQGSRQFSVIREEGATALSPIPTTYEVNFIIEGQEIVISRENRAFLRASLTLNNEGECKLKIGDSELDQWQVRRMALEELFFGPFNKSSRPRTGTTNMEGI